MHAFAWFLALVALALAAIAVFAYPAWMLLHPFFAFPFHRVGERIGMLALLAGFLLVAPRLRLADRVSLGYGLPRRAFLREMSLALALGVASMLAVVGLMGALGLLEWTPAADFSGADLLRLAALRLASGLAVAFIEETFLRGAMHTAIERESGTRLAVLLTALLYAATHFLASHHIAPAQVTPRSGLELLAGTLHSWAQPLRWLRGLAGAGVDRGAGGAVVALLLGTRRARGARVRNNGLRPPTNSAAPAQTRPCAAARATLPHPPGATRPRSPGSCARRAGAARSAAASADCAGSPAGDRAPGRRGTRAPAGRRAGQRRRGARR